MTEEDLRDVVAIERSSFLTPWTRSHFLHELRSNPCAWNVVVRREGSVVAYACLWIVGDELQINNVAVAVPWRHRGIAAALLGHILAGAARRGARTASLEVRPSNVAARLLYAHLGFRQVGVRRGYYQDSGEDALILARDLESIARE